MPVRLQIKHTAICNLGSVRGRPFALADSHLSSRAATLAQSSASQALAHASSTPLNPPQITC